MLKDILILEKSLRAVGKKEAALEIYKVAAPLIDSIPLSGEERKEQVANFPRNDWFDSVKLFQDNIILLHFNASSVDNELIKKLSKVFSGKENLSYGDLKKKYSILSEDVASSLKTDGKAIVSMGAEFQKFKEVFPEVASKAESALSENKINPNGAIFLIYNEKQLKPNETKSPEYLSHDLAHIAWDIFDNEFLQDLSIDIYNISSLYRNASHAPLSSRFYITTRALSTQSGNTFLKEFIPEIFSSADDAVYDLISLCANPNKTITIEVPDSFLDPVTNLSYQIMSYDPSDPGKKESDQIKEANKQEAREGIETIIKKIRARLEEKEFLPNEMMGKVFIMELF
jgi:hypothetical protein